jgi:hypothetical protein
VLVYNDYGGSIGVIDGAVPGRITEMVYEVVDEWVK